MHLEASMIEKEGLVQKGISSIGSRKHQQLSPFSVKAKKRFKNWTEWLNNDQATLNYIWLVCQKLVQREPMLSVFERQAAVRALISLLRALPSLLPLNSLFPHFPSPSLKVSLLPPSICLLCTPFSAKSKTICLEQTYQTTFFSLVSQLLQSESL